MDMDVVMENLDPSDVPPGYKFDPNKPDLITYYLKNKILGRPVPADAIPTVDNLYSKKPDDLPLIRDSEWRKDNEWYFFTTRQDSDLAIDDGYYSTLPDSEEEKILRDNQVIGFMQVLAYYKGQPPKGKKTKWTIYEFRVNPETIAPSELDDDTIRAKVSNFVVCKVVGAKEIKRKRRRTRK